MKSDPSIQVAVLMGSKSDWDTMQHCDKLLSDFGVSHECRVLSAHRTPQATLAFVADAQKRGTQVFIAAAGGAAHLAGVVAAHSICPVIGVPIESASLKGLDSLLATVQMPAGTPVATVAIGTAGAKNSALLAIAILARQDTGLARKLEAFRKEQADKVLGTSLS